MDSKKLKALITGLILLFLVVLGAIFQLPDDKLHLIFCDVGQGDAILALQGENQILIDGGPDRKVLDCLSKHLPFWDRTIEVVVLTHPEADHFTGLIDVIERYNIKQFVINNIVNDKVGFWKFRQGVINEKVAVYAPKEGDEIKVGPVVFSVLWPEQKLGDEMVWNSKAEKEAVLGASAYSGKLNDTSIVLKLSYGQFDALLTGDIDSETETKLATNFLSGIEVLKVAHHGSKYSSGEVFLEEIKPQLAVISVGKNSFGHPTPELIKRLENLGVRILRTDEKEGVEIVSDGKSYDLLSTK